MATLLLALLTGLLFALSLPPFNAEWLGWGAFVPLLLAAEKRRPLEAFGLGMTAGAFCGAVSAGWHHDTARLFWAYIPSTRRTLWSPTFPSALEGNRLYTLRRLAR